MSFEIELIFTITNIVSPRKLGFSPWALTLPIQGSSTGAWDVSYAACCVVKRDRKALTHWYGRKSVEFFLYIHCIVLMASNSLPQPRATHLTDPVTSRDLYGTVRGACSCNACGRYIIYTEQRYTSTHQENSKVGFNLFLGPSNCSVATSPFISL